MKILNLYMSNGGWVGIYTIMGIIIGYEMDWENHWFSINLGLIKIVIVWKDNKNDLGTPKVRSPQ